MVAFLWMALFPRAGCLQCAGQGLLSRPLRCTAVFFPVPPPHPPAPLLSLGIIPPLFSHPWLSPDVGSAEDTSEPAAAIEAPPVSRELRSVTVDHLESEAVVIVASDHNLGG